MKIKGKLFNSVKNSYFDNFTAIINYKIAEIDCQSNTKWIFKLDYLENEVKDRKILILLILRIFS